MCVQRTTTTTATAILRRTEHNVFLSHVLSASPPPPPPTSQRLPIPHVASVPDYDKLKGGGDKIGCYSESFTATSRYKPKKKIKKQTTKKKHSNTQMTTYFHSYKDSTNKKYPTNLRQGPRRPWGGQRGGVSDANQSFALRPPSSPPPPFPSLSLLFPATSS